MSRWHRNNPDQDFSPIERMLGTETTWTCHVCGAERRDAAISVHSSTRDLLGGIRSTVNVRYCNDRRECVTGAPQVADRWHEGEVRKAVLDE